MPDLKYQYLTQKQRDNAFKEAKEYANSYSAFQIMQHYRDVKYYQEQGEWQFANISKENRQLIKNPEDYLFYYFALKNAYERENENTGRTNKNDYQKWLKQISDDFADEYGLKKGEKGFNFDSFYDQSEYNTGYAKDYDAGPNENISKIEQDINITEMYGTEEHLQNIKHKEIIEDRIEKFNSVEYNISTIRNNGDYLTNAKNVFSEIVAKRNDKATKIAMIGDENTRNQEKSNYEKSQEGKDDKEIEKNRLSRLYSDLSDKKANRTWKDWFGISKIINNIKENSFLKTVKNALIGEHGVKEEDLDFLTDNYGKIAPQSANSFHSVTHIIDEKAPAKQEVGEQIISQDDLSKLLSNDTVEKTNGDLSRSNVSNDAPQLDNNLGKN